MQRSLRLGRRLVPHQRPISTQSLEAVRATLPLVAAAGTDFTDHFYQRMFKAHPELLDTFNISNQRQGRQQKALFSAIAASAVSVLETGALPTDLLETVHHKHCALNCQPGQYDVVGEHIVGTIVDLLNPPQEVLDAWTELYAALAKECIDRSEALYRETDGKPGGWRGLRDFVVSRKEVKSSTVTQFTLTPKDGGPVCGFKPGQYTTVWLHPEGWSNRQPRHYTLCGLRPRHMMTSKDYTIAVRRDPVGLVSGYLHDTVAEVPRCP